MADSNPLKWIHNDLGVKRNKKDTSKYSNFNVAISDIDFCLIIIHPSQFNTFGIQISTKNKVGHNNYPMTAGLLYLTSLIRSS